ncbi:GAK10 protein, partial [Psilopogon haemacephalus]|nr:GAK10 protein [Psilopogon haemacephalus]
MQSLAEPTNIVGSHQAPTRTPAAAPPAPISPVGSDKPLPLAESDLAEAIARDRREAWAAFARECLEKGDDEAIEASRLACPVTFTPNDKGGTMAVMSMLDWKLLSQLRSTAGQYGVTSEPTRQMLDYIFGAQLLLPGDCRAIAKLIFTPHQYLLFNNHWQTHANEIAAVRRHATDPLAGITTDELMGLGRFTRTEVQATLGAEKIKEAMRVARLAIDKVKDPGGIPLYINIKQERDEPFGSFVDRLMSAMDKAGVAEHMKTAMLKQCVLQNSSQAVKNILSMMGADWTMSEALERMSVVPTRTQAFLVDAIKTLGLGLQEQARASQNQVLAALAPLQASMATNPALAGRAKCYRCGGIGHYRRECSAGRVWCRACRSDTHNASICRKQSGNSSGSMKKYGNRARTQVAAMNPPLSAMGPPVIDQQPGEALAWTWQPQ